MVAEGIHSENGSWTFAAQTNLKNRRNTNPMFRHGGGSAIERQLSNPTSKPPPAARGAGPAVSTAHGPGERNAAAPPAAGGAGAAVFLALCDTVGNVATSPASLEIALSMAAAGATLDSRTFEELRHVLGHAGTEEDVHARLKQTFEQLLGGGSRTQMIVANSLWASGGIRKEFVACCKSVFSADVFAIESAQKINAWVKEQTRGEIKNLLGKDPTDSVLVNVLYFKAAWHRGFDRENTQNEQFRGYAGDSVCRMMHIPALKCSYGSTENARYVVMPYKGEDAKKDDEGSFCALVVLPNEEDRRGLLKAAEDLFAIPNRVDFAVRNASDGLVMLSMPVFEIDSPARSLKPELQKLGVRGLFESSELTRMSQESTHVSDVLQQVVVKVDEEGTVAAAATAVMMTRGGGGKPSTKFTVDRPFLFVVFDKLSRI